VPVVTPNCTCNTTIPSSGSTPPVVITNCSFFKVCRERPTCNQDQGWWDYWGSDGCGCEHPKYHKKVQRKRICNATDDDTFDSVAFLSNTSYYEACDCVVFMNCTNTTVPVPPTPVVPVPPIPSGSVPCNYSCEDIAAIHESVVNLTAYVTSQQDDIDMLIGQY
jgi:hypothetical protein